MRTTLLERAFWTRFSRIKSTNRPGVAVTNMDFFLLLHNHSIWSCRSIPPYTATTLTCCCCLDDDDDDDD
eukprot:CAMPEP_0198300534 /NCGR_PEP_ID=MMETSP1449-20131203/48577_1 /TAXON_ID=420275 /ORGANISM="Attheya septentrionalis, Strain CCMP2084" /LENGTH=69 /DNA_ID=CAMNT_0044002391 /DNA_START=366 /DNA_END=572 /DNA_ORIENTATION=+